MITVGIPVKEPCSTLPYVLRRLNEIKKTSPDSIFEVKIESKGSLSEARLSLAQRAHTPYILNLDADTLIPLDYLRVALSVLKAHVGVGAVALDYCPDPQGHLSFGTSIMPTSLMCQIYDWKGPDESRTCECLHVWRRLTAEGLILATLPMGAQHLKHHGEVRQDA